jgi:hypothetical protein
VSNPQPRVSAIGQKNDMPSAAPPNRAKPERDLQRTDLRGPGEPRRHRCAGFPDLSETNTPLSAKARERAEL